MPANKVRRPRNRRRRKAAEIYSQPHLAGVESLMVGNGLDRSDTEAGTIVLGNKLVGFGEIGDLKRGGIPLDPTTRADRDVAEQDGFRKARGVVEIRSRWRPA